MNKKHKGKYRPDTTRAKWWDYGNNGAYFVTINAYKRKHYFGVIKKGEMILSEIGNIAKNCWLEIPEHFPYVDLGAFVVMPDHVHGVIIINKPRHEKDDYLISRPSVKAQDFAPHFAPPNNTFGPQSKNLASIVRGLKVGVTKNARKIDPNFAWQSRYHDHIIKNEIEHNHIESYIINNPKNWEA
ncbi:transposase [Planktosalinus lacus]|uniref:Transposase IS200-like domain-containing protein n=1 Tax=Planktosalinus lacus TaxID=1526573 RepID=A0A8J2V8V6_9FLAO|nr:transposase [Planktosalinus lacus]GGD85633.1 hypothetical protein GCM10011312_07130 [Planktosalinus lacus]